MKKRIIVFWAALVSLQAAYASAAAPATIHVILFSATHDSRVGSSCEETNKYFELTFVPQLRDYTGAAVKTYFFSGADFTLGNLNRTLTSLNTSANDAIFFYFAGHGYNRGQSVYPTMTLGRDDEELEGRQMDLTDVYGALRQKQRRLLVVMAEACNKPFPTKDNIQGGTVMSNFNVDPANKNNYWKLFREASGDYIASSSVKGEYSYLAAGNPGFFTCAFKDAMREVTGKTYFGAVTWEAVFGKTAAIAAAFARENGRTQSPQWQKGDSRPVSAVQPPAQAQPAQPPVARTGGGAGGSSGNALVDPRDGKSYRIVNVGGKTWMAENLNYQTGNSWCYDNSSSNCNRYGRLYDWSTATGACPSGWHLSSREEWNSLEKAAGGSASGKRLKSKAGWDNRKNGSSGNGTDDYGWSAAPGGQRHAAGSFLNAGEGGSWWSAAEGGSGSAYYRSIHHYNDYVYEHGLAKDGGLSVRCVQD